jgi:cyclophilin family peptidyl-prolyl cis-trans isomerase
MLRIFTLLCALLVSLPAAAANPQVELATSMGTIVIELEREKAPQSADNFLQYVKEGHYNGTVFHRVIPGFMVQGGGFTPDMREKPTRSPIKNEAGNGLRNVTGTLAMARTPNPHSAAAQFFINVADNAFLDFRAATPEGYGYAVFGKVVKGMDVVNRIVQVPTTSRPPHANVPQKPVVIERARIIGAAAASK